MAVAVLMIPERGEDEESGQSREREEFEKRDSRRTFGRVDDCVKRDVVRETSW